MKKGDRCRPLNVITLRTAGNPEHSFPRWQVLKTHIFDDLPAEQR